MEVAGASVDDVVAGHLLVPLINLILVALIKDLGVKEGQLAEFSLHASLKRLYVGENGRTEVPLAGWRVDGLVAGQVIEIQTGPFLAIRKKICSLLRSHSVLLVKPVPAQKILCWVDENGNPVRRRIIRVGNFLLNAFDDLVYFTRIFPHPHLAIRFVGVTVEEKRLSPRYIKSRSRRRRSAIVDVILAQIVGQVDLHTSADLLRLLPGSLPGIVDAARLSDFLGVPVWQARKILYCLRECGAARQVGYRRRFRVYELLGQASCTTPTWHRAA